MNRKLRIGLLIDSILLPAWVFTAVKRLLCSDVSELTLVILNQSETKGHSSPRGLLQNFNHWLYYVLNTVDERVFLHGENALEPLDASELFTQVPVLKVKPIAKHDMQRFSAADVEVVNSFQLDILVKLGFGKLHGDILSSARYGVWAYRWGDHRKIEDGLTGFWEAVQGWPETGAALQRLGTEPKQHRILFESWFFTYPYSPARSRNYVLWAAASFLPRQIERLYRLGEKKFFQQLNQRVAEELQPPLRPNDIPSNLSPLWIAGILIARNFLELYRRGLYREQWHLLLNFGDHTENDITSFKKISPPKDRFWADPHVIYKEPNYYVFVEEYPYQTKKGHISVIEMDREGNCKQPIPVLQADCHLSFPFVFGWRGHYYMVPESSGKRTIDLYECTKFPDQWKHKITLMTNVKAVDTTLLYDQGKWWLFTAIAEQEAAAPQVELFLFYSEELFTDQWRPHPMNPIVSDVKRARAAGSIFEKNRKLFRPSQYGSSTYGYGFDLNEIVILSETEYCERRVSSVRPDPTKGIFATHSYANQEDLMIIDALTRQFKWAKPA